MTRRRPAVATRCTKASKYRFVAYPADVPRVSADDDVVRLGAVWRIRRSTGANGQGVRSARAMGAVWETVGRCTVACIAKMSASLPRRVRPVAAGPWRPGRSSLLPRRHGFRGPRLVLEQAQSGARPAQDPRPSPGAVAPQPHAPARYLPGPTGVSGPATAFNAPYGPRCGNGAGSQGCAGRQRDGEGCETGQQ